MLKLNNKKANSPNKKWTKDLNRYLPKEDIQMANKYMERCSTLYVIREVQTKTTIRYLYILVRMAQIQNFGSIKCYRGCGTLRILIHGW